MNAIEQVLERGLDYLLKTVAPELAGLLPGPVGWLIKAALNTDWVKSLEQKLETATGEEIEVIIHQCAAWWQDVLTAHPDAAKMWAAIAPQTLDFDVEDPRVLTAFVAALKDGTAAAKLGVV